MSAATLHPVFGSASGPRLANRLVHPGGLSASPGCGPDSGPVPLGGDVAAPHDCAAGQPCPASADQARIHRRRDALARGVTDDQIRRMCAGGRWRRLRRGVYSEEAAYAELDVLARHRILAAAVLPDMAADAVVSHQSAAAIYGAPIWAAPMDRLCVTRNRRNGGRIKPDLKVHCAPIDSVAEVGGLLLSTPARTIVDLGRTVPFESAVVAGDWLAREYGVTAADLDVELEAANRRRGIDRARLVAKFLNPHSESVGESRSRVMLRELGLPIPRSQGDVFTAEGRFLGRVDFYFGDTGVVGEFDGRTRYGRRTQPGHDPADTAAAERRREDALRSAGFHVIRWTWDELPTDAVTARFRVALARVGRQRPQGHIRQSSLPEPRPLMIRSL
ncbi:endonuclease domain-containing protein [Nocardia miyunensis]|uniref:endonuclease domain-containing protein n=1 Tax=Nocardia miyunensis TaxID=282684 RepID=UPI001FE01D75|nr:endonuclease domain-containing protein [Nocardia miyunensis]